jgi:hypothetical protein
MSKAVSYCILVVAVGVVLALAACAPNVLSDENEFLKNFIGQGLLDVLGVILAITLASAGNLHLVLNQIEERHSQQGFGRMRAGIRMAAAFLIGLFVIAIVLTVAKASLATAPWSQSLFNGFGLIVLLWNVLLLISLTEGVFAIKADLPNGSEGR